MIRYLTALLLVALPAHADDAIWQQLSLGGEAKVVSVIDGDTVVIDPALDDMAEVRLVGIQAPKLALGREGFTSWPMSDTAKIALERIVTGQTVQLYYGDRRADRHGRHLAHLRLDDGTWVQGRLLEDGWARVYSFPDNRALVADMLAREQDARRRRAGIWSHANYRVRSPDELPDLIGRFEVAEGTVKAANVVNGTLYLNFGDDWRTDFTLRARRSALDLFETDGIEPASYEGRQVRARGWLKDFNGPMIDVTHPEQIEILP